MAIELFEAQMSSPVGSLRLIAHDNALVAVCWHDDDKTPYAMHLYPTQQQHPLLVTAQQQLQEYFDCKRQHFDLPIDFLFGTVFQKQVWQALCDIEFGKTTSYSHVAIQMNRPKAVRAVATAIAHNPLSIIVPCHRVIGKNGDLRGFAGGLKNKQDLLELEHI